MPAPTDHAPDHASDPGSGHAADAPPLRQGVADQATTESPAERWLPFLDGIADQADSIALRHFRARDLRVATKPDASPVTEADEAIEAAARTIVRLRHPELGVLGEEAGDEPGPTAARLIIDPIDGTANFIRGIPIFATLLAIEEDGEVTAGLVSAPALGVRWQAARGHGAYRGDRRLQVSSVAKLEDAQLFHADLRDAAGTFLPPEWAALYRRGRRTRGFGDFYQHLLVAEGCGELALDPIVKPWDVAPLVVIVEEAGGRVTALTGERSLQAGSLVSSNGLVHDEALALLGQAPATP
ncbi:MAG: inositol monophosphatase family protein [Candidatus Krumholzibacteriia bacterium]